MTSMVAASGWFTYKTILSYINKPTVTNVQTVPTVPIQLPDMIICYAGGLNVSAMKVENFSENLIKTFSALYSGAFLKSMNVTAAKIEVQEYMKNNLVDTNHLLNKFGYDCEDILKFIWVGFNELSCREDASAIVGSYGKCYLFQNLAKQYYPDSSGGIQVVLEEPDNSFSNTYMDAESDMSIPNGFSISLENDFGNQPTSKYLLIPTNVVAEIALYLRHYKRFPNGVACNDSDKLYNTNTCFIECYIQATERVCHCVDPYYWYDDLSIRNLTICGLNDLEHCQNYNRTTMYLCQSKCLPKCDEWNFESTVTYHILYSGQSQKAKSIVRIYHKIMQYIEVNFVFGKRGISVAVYVCLKHFISDRNG